MKQLKQSELKNYRLSKLPKKCSITEIELNEKNSVVDHIHGSHKSIFPETNKLIRDVIHFEVNTLIGKIENQYLRISKELKEIPLSDLLRNIADYIEKYSKIENYNELLIHPSEWKPKKIKKSWFNKLKKEVKEKYNKEINYPKSGKLTKEVKKYSELLNIEPEYY